ncbi:NAD(+) diphosphatase [Psychrobacter aquaticus]|uniref:NAD(+) diphosphatase n=1 Tax=Psychrobacter aquaticus CMS 56 TaxID=1354303 RepID=U4T4T3_9GAMM|nr:NAD(+) diphosphatase [Psychrobacter aquaticus]ERL55920.1 NADH pyrophosphatase [Psychrobacter aquaticus CMS 56]
MTRAFVFSDDTLLCRQMPDGWWPLQVQLPEFNSILDDSTYQQAYQIGHVTLLESLSPSHWLPDSLLETAVDVAHDLTDNNSFTALATSAITYDYAITHDVILPIIAETSGNAFVPYRQLIPQLPAALSTQVSQAIQLLRWQADTQFCSRCAAPVVHAETDERAMVCPVCRLRQYPRVQPCVITAVTRPNPQTGEMQILLAHHHRYGEQKLPLMYGLIAGFVEVGESLEHAVVREVAEEVNISVKDIRYVSSQPWPFPSNLMLGFRASYASGDIIIQEDELSHADFFDISNLPKIPPKGSIARELIDQIAKEQKVLLSN